MRDKNSKTRRNVLKGIGGSGLALIGTGITSAEKPKKESKEPEGRIIKEEVDKSIIEHIVQDYGTNNVVNLVTCELGKNGEVSIAEESIINLENISSLREAENDESLTDKISDHLGTNIENESSKITPTAHGGHNTNYSIEKISVLGNIQWKLTLYSTWNWDEEERVIDTPYGFTFGYTTGNPYTWKGLQNSEITGLGTSEGHHRIKGKFEGYVFSDTMYIEIGFIVRALTEGVDYKTAERLS